ncbi:MAG: glycoside hydrolase family 3 N-terminal domain-containing protein [Campylobacterota bacterium]|nr:glycoside hydrolase family 3 N-terminal domain-containing protein [Campylobacterota bacterium]
MIKYLFITVVALLSIQMPLAAASSQDSPEKMAGSMLMVGFHGTSAKPGSQICKDIQEYNLAGVILFDYNPVDKSKPKNIASKGQLAKLTKELQKCSKDGKLLIAVDQEGGKVQRLKAKYGFNGKFPKASDVSKMKDGQVAGIYKKMGGELKGVGINYDLAPVVDLDINPKNHVIHGLGRSFGKDPGDVAHYASIFINSMHKKGVLTSIKHFPGHGSSTGDTHKGFVDVTQQWKKAELEPYRILIGQGRVDTVMVAHVFNKKIDSVYPATLSSKTVNGLLRKKLGFQGVVITDDLQMGAISKKYGLKNTIKLAVNAGDDILLFGNQLDPNHTVSTKKLVDMMILLVKSGDIKQETIKRANVRVAKLKKKL